MNRKFKFLVVIALLKERSNLVVGQVGIFVEILDDENFEIEFSNSKGDKITTCPVNQKDFLLPHFEMEAV